MDPSPSRVALPPTFMSFHTCKVVQHGSHDIGIAMQDKEPAPGRPRLDMEAFNAAVHGSAQWKHDKFEGPSRRSTLAKGRGVGKAAIDGYRLCDSSTPLF